MSGDLILSLSGFELIGQIQSRRMWRAAEPGMFAAAEVEAGTFEAEVGMFGVGPGRSLVEVGK